MKTFQSIKEKLVAKKIPIEEITFTDEAVSARDVDSSLDKNYDPKTAIKTLVITTKNGYKALILKGDDRVDEKKLNKLVGKWSVVSEKTLREKFGFLPGCVCPLDLDRPFLIDENVLKLDIWSMGACDPKKGINIKSKIVLTNITNKQIVSIKK